MEYVPMNMNLDFGRNVCVSMKIIEFNKAYFEN